MTKHRTLYSACLARLDLSQSEAAALHGIRLDSVKAMATGKRAVPAGLWDELRAYEAQIVARSEATSCRADLADLSPQDATALAHAILTRAD